MLQLQPAAGGAAVPADAGQIIGIKTDLGLEQVNNTPDAAKPIQDAQVAVNAAQAAAIQAQADAAAANASAIAANAGAIAGKAAIADLGGPPAVLKLNAIATAMQMHKVGHSVLLVCASTGARCNNLYGVPSVSSYSRDAFGNVTVTTGKFADCGVNRLLKINANNDGRIDAICRVTSATTTGSSTTIVMRELYNASPRPAIAAGGVSGTSMLVHDLQSNGNTHSWLAKANSALGAILDVLNFSCGGTIPSDWTDTNRMAYMRGLPQFDTAIVDFGYGNSVTAPVQSPEQLVPTLNTALALITTKARHVQFIGVAGGRFGGDSALVANPGATADMTTLMRLNTWMRSFLAENWPTVEYVDVMSDFLSSSMFGSADTSDLLAGRSPPEYQDADGVHYMPAGDDVVGRAAAAALIKHVRAHNVFGHHHIDHVFANTAADLGGRFNPSGLYEWNGAVETAPVTATTNAGSASIGTGIGITTVNALGVTGNTTMALSVVNGKKHGGREMELLIGDPDGGLSIALNYFGTTAFRIRDVLNDSRFLNVDLDALLDWGFLGFNQNSVFKLEASLYGVTAAGTQRIANWLCDDGTNTMFGGQSASVKRAWCFGPSGPYRAGNGPIQVPPLTYTDGYIGFTIVGVAGVPMGIAKLRVGRKRLTARQLLA